MTQDKLDLLRGESETLKISIHWDIPSRQAEVRDSAIDHWSALSLVILQDVDEIQVYYPSMYELMQDLKGNSVVVLVCELYQ